MRPLSLTLDGFRSYAARTEIDWRGSRLVGIVGPIGSGKSTILDAIAFSLFGMTPGERANTKALIHQRADIAQVELVFTVDGQVWRTVRAIRRFGQSEHALFRYASDDAFLEGQKAVETVVKKGEVDARIRLLLGMDFEAFGRSALLAQGRFAELLRATPTQRDEVLKGVFGFDKVADMERIAKQRRDTVTRDLEELARRSESFEEDTAQLAIATTEAARSESSWQTFEAAAPVLNEMEQAVESATSEMTDTEKALAALASVAEKMPDPVESMDLIEDASRAEAGASRLDGEARLLEDAALAATQVLSDVLESFGGEAGLAEATDQVGFFQGQVNLVGQARERSAAASAEAQEAAALVDSTASEAQEAAAIARQAEIALTQAETYAASCRDQWHAAQHLNMAATLRADLDVGHECPVCKQPVQERVRDEGSEEELAAAESELQAGLESVERASKAAATALQAKVRGESHLDATRAASLALIERAEAEKVDLAKFELEMKETLVRLEALLGRGEPTELLAARREAIASARAGAEEATRQLKGLKDRRIDQLAAAEESLSRLDSLRTKLAELAGRIDLDLAIADGVDGVRDALRVVRETWTSRNQALTDTQHEIKLRISALQGAIDEKRAALGIPDDVPWADAIADSRVRAERARAELTVRAERVQMAGSIGDDIRAAEASLELYSELSKELRPSRFLNYLLEEERAALAQLGSHQFEDLTGGRYRFSEDGDFAIVDLTAAEQVRKSDTLSGGETFLASLALALALAEMMTRSGGRIDAFFLDEGFGSLDPEHLDLALAGIERLVATDEERLVVLVSHVPDMVERIEHLITLDKDPVTGATRVIV